MAPLSNKINLAKCKNYINYISIGIIAVIFSTITFTSGLPQSTLFLLEKITMNIILAVSLSLVVGFLGELSLGHAGFMCIGAYIGGKAACMMDKFTDGKGIVSLLVSIVIGAVVAGIFGFIIGLPALRLKGDYLAIVTLAFGEIVKTVFENTGVNSFGGPIGLRTPRFDKKYLFVVGFVLVLVTLAVMQNLIRSKHGRAITAIRDNEIAARATGINVTKYKIVGFVISSAFAGVAGVFYSFANSTVKASVFDYNFSIEILIMVVLGGMGSINGAIISATLITYINTQLQTVLTGDLAVLKDVIYALILVLIVVYSNAPKLKYFREKYNIGVLVAKIPMPKWIGRHYANDDGQWARIPTKIQMDELLSTDIVVTESVLAPDKEEK